MSVFFTNDCKHANCGKCFKTLPDLIRHIEATHIDFSTKATDKMEEQKLESVPMSLILKFDNSIKTPDPKEIDTIETSEKEAGKTGEFIDLSSVIAHGLQNDEELFLPDTLNNHEIITTKDAMKKLRREQFIDRPFQCPVPNCSKRYKNVNGIKYHLNNGHKESECPNSTYKPKYKKERSVKSSLLKSNPTHNSHLVDSGSPIIHSSQNRYQLLPETLDNYNYSPNINNNNVLLQNNNDNIFTLTKYQTVDLDGSSTSVSSEYIFPPTVNLSNNSTASSSNDLM